MNASLEMIDHEHSSVLVGYYGIVKDSCVHSVMRLCLDERRR